MVSEKNFDSVVIVSSARTPIGNFQGGLSGFSGSDLGGIAVDGVLSKTSISKEIIDDLVMGCVLSAGMGQAPARQAAVKGGIPMSAGATTINKMCGSGMRAVMIANDQLIAGTSKVMIAGGFESMSNAPYLLHKARGGYRMGNNKIYDHMFVDGLEDAIEEPGKLMGGFAEDTAQHYQFTRKQQDEFAIESLRRARKANEKGYFAEETIKISGESRKKKFVIEHDELPFSAQLEKIPTLKPAFRQEGTVTAANSSAISDGAAALLLMLESQAEKLGLEPLAKIVGHVTQSQESAWFTTAPIGAIKKLFSKINWTRDDVDLFEINEAFAVVTMAAIKDIGIDHERVNINGGACALGHPIGASGARIIVTLYHALKNNNLRKGIASLCIGGGEATALAIELIQ